MEILREEKNKIRIIIIYEFFIQDNQIKIVYTYTLNIYKYTKILFSLWVLWNNNQNNNFKKFNN